MLWRVYLSAAYRVVVDVGYLLVQHFVALDDLGVCAFLPDLVIALVFVAFLLQHELDQQINATCGSCQGDDLSRGVAFEFLNYSA